MREDPPVDQDVQQGLVPGSSTFLPHGVPAPVRWSRLSEQRIISKVPILCLLATVGPATFPSMEAQKVSPARGGGMRRITMEMISTDVGADP